LLTIIFGVSFETSDFIVDGLQPAIPALFF
jgi:hypothetical protein